MNNRIAYMLFYLKSIIMKAKGRNLFTLITILFSTLGYSQQLVAEVEYIKLEPGKWKEFSELRKDVLIPYNQGRMDADMIVGWGLYERMHTGADDPYTHIIVSIYDDYLKTENSVNWEWINENFSEEEVAAMMERFRETWTVVKEDVYFNITALESPADSKYLTFDRIKTFKGQGPAFRKLIKEISKPVFERTIADGVKSSWSVWMKFLPDESFNHVIVNSYTEFGQWRKVMQLTHKIAEEVHPDISMEEILEKFNATRSIESRELWKLLDVVKPPA